eukprot:RCo020281
MGCCRSSSALTEIPDALTEIPDVGSSPSRGFCPLLRILPDPLNEADLCATWRCVVELNGHGFINIVIHSGRSQPRKHTQIIPLPFLSGQSATPRDDAITFVAACSAPDSLRL